MKTKFLIELFSKSSWCPEAKPLGALRRVRNTLSVKAHFREFGPLLQEKRGPRTDCKQRLTSKIIQWMIFDGTSLNLVLAEHGTCLPTMQRWQYCFVCSGLYRRTDVRQHRNSTLLRTVLDFCFYVGATRPKPSQTFVYKSLTKNFCLLSAY